MNSWRYNTFTKNIRNVTIKNRNRGQKMEEEYVPFSIICAVFVKKEVKLITFLDYKKEFR